MNKKDDFLPFEGKTFFGIFVLFIFRSLFIRALQKCNFSFSVIKMFTHTNIYYSAFLTKCSTVNDDSDLTFEIRISRGISFFVTCLCSLVVVYAVRLARQKPILSTR